MGRSNDTFLTQREWEEFEINQKTDMETKRSKPTEITFKKEHTGSYGPVYYFTIKFANGDSGAYGSKSKDQTAFILDKEVEYTIESKVNGNYTNHYIKLPVTNGSPAFTPKDPKAEKVKQHLIVRQNALTNAVAFANAENASLKADKHIDSKQIMQVADVFYNWVIGPFKDQI
jgi:hypothetical protein